MKVSTASIFFYLIVFLNENHTFIKRGQVEYFRGMLIVAGIYIFKVLLIYGYFLCTVYFVCVCVCVRKGVG